MTEEVINYRVEYDIRGVDQSIRETQRVLYFMNATRLAVVDLQQVMSGPTLSNVMWTSVQLTRVWTHLYRLVKQTNQAQRIGMAQGVIGGAGGRAVSGAVTRRFALGQTMLTLGERGELGAVTPTSSGLMSLVTANPYVAGGIAVALLTAGLVGYDMHQRRMQEDWRKRQREIAKSQGLEI